MAWTLTGFTFNEAGAAVAASLELFDAIDGIPVTVLQSTTANATTGKWSFSGLTDGNAYDVKASYLGQVDWLKGNANFPTSLISVLALKVTNSINDVNNNEIIKIGSTASAVNEITVTNAATGTNPQVSASGTDTNIDLDLTGKGTGWVKQSNTGLYVPNNCFVQAAMSGDQSLSTGVWTKVTFNTEDTDQQAEYNAATQTFTPERTGQYLWVCGLRFNNVVANDNFRIGIYNNGVASITEILDERFAPGTLTNFDMRASIVLTLTAGVGVSPYAYASPGRTIDSQSGETYISITKLTIIRLS